MEEEEYVQEIFNLLEARCPKSEDIASIMLRDEVDSLISFVATSGKTIDNYVNSFDQGLLHIAGILLLVPF